MEIAVVGAQAQSLCRAAGVRGIQPFSALAQTDGRVWDLLALSADAAHTPFSGVLRAHSLLLPGDSAPSLAAGAQAAQIIGYGFSPRDTLTLSSFAGRERLLCLQRGLLTLDGALLEPQELPLPEALCALREEDALFIAGLRLLCGWG